MVEEILNNTTPYRKIRASHEGSLHSSTLNKLFVIVIVQYCHDLNRTLRLYVGGIHLVR